MKKEQEFATWEDESADEERGITINTNRKKKKVRTILTAVVALIVLCVTIGLVIDKKNAPDMDMPISEEEKKVNEAIKQIKDNVDSSKITKEESDKNKKILEEKKSNQEKSTDIVIPDNASEEEKKELEQKKEVLEAGEKLSSLYGKISNDQYKSEIIDINHIWLAEDGAAKGHIYVLVDTIDYVNGSYIKCKKCLELDEYQYRDMGKNPKSEWKYLIDASKCDIVMTQYENSENMSILSKALKEFYEGRDISHTYDICVAQMRRRSDGIIGSMSYILHTEDKYIFLKILTSDDLLKIPEEKQIEYLQNNKIITRYSTEYVLLNIEQMSITRDPFDFFEE